MDTTTSAVHRDLWVLALCRCVCCAHALSADDVILVLIKGWGQ